MPYAIVAAGVSVAGGAMQGRQAASEAKKGRALQREQMDFAKQQYQDYKDMYGSVEASLLEEVESYQPGEKLQTYLGESAADVAMAFDKRRGMATREMGRFGIDPSQARFEERQDELGRERALAEVGGRTTARRKSEAEDDKQFARRLAMLSTGKEIPGQSGAVMGALQTGAAMHGERAAQYGRGAAASFGAAGQWGAKAMDKYSGGGYGGDGGGMAGPTAGVDYGVPTSNVYGGAGYGDADVDYD